MNKPTIFALGAATSAIGLVGPLLVSDFLAQRISQRLWDCGVRVAQGTEGGDLGRFMIRGHKFGLCIDGAENLQIKDVWYQSPGSGLVEKIPDQIRELPLPPLPRTPIPQGLKDQGLPLPSP